MNKMKRSFMHIKIIAVVMLLLSACSQEDEYVAKGDNEILSEGIELTVSAADFVTDGAPDTRATDDGNRTTFDEGDRVGVIILDKGGSLLYNNIPYVYKSGNWTFDSKNDEGKGGCYYDPKAKTYIVYYPYSRAVDGVRSKEGLKTIFAPKFNQSDIKNYRSSDLMVWDNSSLIPPVTTLNAELTHAFASISLTPKAYILDDGNSTKGNAKVSDVSLTIDDNVYVPYQATDGSLRCIVPASINPSIRCFYTFSGKTYGNTINISDPVAPNTRYTSAPEIISEKLYTLTDAKVGDFYCKRSDKNEGYLIPSEVALTNDQKDACIGIVYCTDPNRIGNVAKTVLEEKGVATPRGLVMALTNASDACRWGNGDVDENGDPFKDNTNTLKKQYSNVDGYAETHWILKTYSGNALRDTYSAFYHASRYGTAEAQAQYTVPNATTGWFIPSMGQWWDILSYLGGIKLTDYSVSDHSDTSISGAARTAVDNMNNYLGKIEGATKFNTGTHFWSSSEYGRGYAGLVSFDIGGSLYLNGNAKNTSRKVRCVFAF